MSATFTRTPEPRRKKVKVAPPSLDPPSGFRNPKDILARSKRNRSYCGPWVVMAITGRSFEEVRAALNEVRGRDLTRRVGGTGYSQVRNALQTLGVRATDRTREIKKAVPHGETITLARFLRERPPEDVNKAFVVAAGNHWVLVKGRKVTCAILGCWTWLRHAKKRRGTVDCVIEIDEVDKVVARHAGEAIRKKLTAIEKSRAVTRNATVSDRNKAVALLRKLGCGHDWHGRGDDLEISVNAPSGKRHFNGLSTETYYSWGEVLRAYNYKPDALFEDDEDDEDA